VKAGIITHYDVHNHGAHLQLYALARQLGQLGYDAHALQYKKNYDFLASGAEAKYSISLRSIPIYIKYLMQHGIKRTLYNIKKKKMLEAFRRNQRLVGEYYSKANDLDVAVIGSDEIFSIETGLNPWFIGMGVPCRHVISYAASFGPTTLDFIKEHHAEEFVSAGLKRIDQISVRDQNSAAVVEHYKGARPPIVCDPVILYDFSKERVKHQNCAPAKTKYCIVYSYDNHMNDPETVKAIKQYAKLHRMKIYSVGYHHKWCDRNIHASPLELFDWFEKAQLVFTDTFHGTVLSLVTGSQFFAKIGTNQNKMMYLLTQFGVQSQLVSSFNEVNGEAERRIDYDVVNERIREVKRASLDYLKRALGIVE